MIYLVDTLSLIANENNFDGEKMNTSLQRAPDLVYKGCRLRNTWESDPATKNYMWTTESERPAVPALYKGQWHYANNQLNIGTYYLLPLEPLTADVSKVPHWPWGMIVKRGKDSLEKADCILRRESG